MQFAVIVINHNDNNKITCFFLYYCFDFIYIFFLLFDELK